MKNKTYLFAPALLALFLSLFFAATQTTSAYAQDGCTTDAAGTVTCPPPACGTAGGPACPPPAGDGSSDYQNPTTVPTVTSTPFPLAAAPTSTPVVDEGYLGSCTNADENIFDCFEQFKCEDGLLVVKVDLYTGSGTKYDFYCIPDKDVPQLDLPITLPADDGATDNWTGGCNADAYGSVDACLDVFSAICNEEGGDISIWNEDDGSAGFYCQNESEANQTIPTEAPALAAAPQGTPAPEPQPKPSTPWVPIGLGILGIVLLIGLLLPAVQKAREAAR